MYVINRLVANVLTKNITLDVHDKIGKALRENVGLPKKTRSQLS